MNSLFKGIVLTNGEGNLIRTNKMSTAGARVDSTGRSREKQTERKKKNLKGFAENREIEKKKLHVGISHNLVKKTDLEMISISVF